MINKVDYNRITRREEALEGVKYIVPGEDDDHYHITKYLYYMAKGWYVVDAIFKIGSGL